MRPSKYKKEYIDKIIELRSDPTYTVSEICKAVKITEETYYKWKNTKKSFSDAIKKVEQSHLSKIKEMARNSLAKKIAGYNYDEVVMEQTLNQETNEKKLVKKRVVKKHIPPSDTCIIFANKTLDPENFPERQIVEIGFADINDKMIKFFNNLKKEIKDPEVLNLIAAEFRKVIDP